MHYPSQTPASQDAASSPIVPPGSSSSPYVSSDQWHPSIVLQSVAECLTNGVWILNSACKLVYANGQGHKLHDLFCSNTPSNKAPDGESEGVFPERIQRICRALIDSDELFPTSPIIIEDKVVTAQGTEFHIRAQRFKLTGVEECHVLLLLEDRSQSSPHSTGVAHGEDQLAPRQDALKDSAAHSENFNAQAMAEKSLININTVRKHIQNIRSRHHQHAQNHQNGEVKFVRKENDRRP